MSDKKRTESESIKQNSADDELADPLSAEYLASLATAAQEAAKLGGDELLKWLGVAKVQEKGPRDFVTDADFASQQVISEFLLGQFPGHRFLGEEDEPHSDGLPADSADGDDMNPFCWIVDPLDGTTNFVHQLPSFSVSIGLQYRGQPLVGVVWDPVMQEMFVGVRGQGASLNGEPIRNSGCVAIADAMIVISFIKGVTRKDEQIGQFLNLLETAGTIRRLGSAALNLSYVAMGRVDGYWAQGLKAWDTAAGALIATEAGAVIKQLNGLPFETDTSRFVCASSEALHGQIVETLLRSDV